MLKEMVSDFIVSSITPVADSKANQEDLKAVEVKCLSFERRLNVLDRWAAKTDEYNEKLMEMTKEFIEEEQKTLKVLQAELNAIMNTPWYKMITKKQKAKVLGTAILEARKES